MPLFTLLFLLFIFIPLAELAVLMQVGARLGALNTIALCLLTAFVGALLVRLEGLETLFRIQKQLRAGVVPAGELIEGMALFAAGAMLLTPGFITDGIGFLLLTPPLRRPAAAWAARHLFTVETEQERSGSGPPPGGASGGRVYEAEAWERDDEVAAGPGGEGADDGRRSAPDTDGAGSGPEGEPPRLQSGARGGRRR